MKKLFTLFATVLFAASMMAQTTVDFTKATISDVAEFTLEGFTFKTLKNDGSTAPTQNGTAKDIRIYAKGTLEVISDANMTEMVFAVSTAGKKRLTDITPNTGSVAIDATAWTVTWTGNANDVIFTVGDKATYGTEGNTKAGQFDIDNVVITTGTAPAVAKPTISAESVTFETSTTVTITAAEGATIYYTTDGNDPTTASTQYSASFTAEQSMTVKAIAVVGQDVSAVASLVLTKVEQLTVSEAKARIDDNNLGACKVYGRIVSIDASKIATYKNLNCWFVDLTNPKDTMEGFKMNGAENKPYASETDVEYIVGDTVLFYANGLKNYNGTYEINEGYYIKTLGAAERSEEIKIDFTSGSAKATPNDITFAFAGTNTSLDIENYEPSNAFYTKAMAGVYTINLEDEIFFDLTVNGAEISLVEGTMTLSYVDINAAGTQNIYRVQLSAKTADNKLYTSDNTFEVNCNVLMENDNNNIDVAYALNVCEKTGETATTELYNIYGYIASIKTAYSTQYGNASYYLTDTEGGTTGTFMAFQAKSAAELPVGAKVKVSNATLVNYKGNTPETNNKPNIEVVSTFPTLRHGTVADTFKVSVLEALEIGYALDSMASTEDYYRVCGYAQTTYEYSAQYKNQTWYMNDTINAIGKSEFQCYQCYVPSATDTVCEGAYVEIVGKITRYYKNGKFLIQMSKGSTVLIERPATGLWNNEATEQKATKTIENGRIIIRRGEKQFDIVGQAL